MNLGERIRTLREERKWSQQRLSDLTKRHGGTASRAAISLWESGNTKNLRQNNLMAVASAFGMSMEQLLTGKYSGAMGDGGEPHKTAADPANGTYAASLTRAQRLAAEIEKLPDNSAILDAIELMLKGAVAGGSKPVRRPASGKSYGAISGTHGK